MQSNLGYKWVILVLAWLIYFSFGLISGALPPLVTPIKDSLNLTYTQMGVILGSWQLLYIFVAYPSGLLIDRLGPYKSLLLGVTIISISSVLRGVAFNFVTLFSTVGLFGLGGCMISIGLPKLISSWFSGRGRGTATGIYPTGSTAGIIAALMLTNSVVLPIVGTWENVFFFYSIFGFLVTITWLLLGRRNPITSSKDEISSSGMTQNIGKIFRLRNVWLIVIVGISGFLVSHGLNNWLPKMLELIGISPANAGSITSSRHIFAIIGSTLIPSASSLVKSKRLLISTVLFVTGIGTFTIGISGGSYLLWVGLALSSVCLGSLMPLLMLTLMDMPEVGPKYMGAVGGMYFAIGEIGGFSGPFLMGFLKDLTGSFLSGIIFLSVVCEAMILLVAFLKE